MQHQNILKLRGTVDAVQGKNIVLATEEVTPAGRVYPHQTPIVAHKIRHGFKAGQRIECLASLKQNEETRMTEIVCHRMAETDAPDDLNLAKVVGVAARSFEFFDRNRGQRPFGNLLMRVGRDFIRSVAFGHLSRSLSRHCKRGAILEFYGRVNHRTFERSDGEGTGEMIEIHIDHDRCRILEIPEQVDEFADVTLGSVDATESSAPLQPATAPAAASANDEVPF